MKVLTGIIAVVVVVLLIALLLSCYVVNEGQQAVITHFGKPVAVKTDAGIYLKLPLVARVQYFPKRLQPWDGAPDPVTTGDKKSIFVDVWGRWRIVDAMRFFQSVRTPNRGNGILDELVDSAVRDVIARYPLIETVRSSNRDMDYESEELAEEAKEKREQIQAGRAQIESDILAAAGAELAERYGMELADVHIKRINYGPTVRQRVYARMRSERTRIAKLFESEGREQEAVILGETEELLQTIQGQMERESAEIRGQADAEVIRIAADAYSKSPEFYQFLRSLEAYKQTLGQNTVLVLSTDNDFLRHLRSQKVRPVVSSDDSDVRTDTSQPEKETAP